MIETIYVERDVADHPRTLSILARFPAARVIECERYGEIFNRKAQDFRAQKQKPSLILAHKEGTKVLPAPGGYAIGGERHYYFSHMLNCLYDCRYCFLQGMYRSAHYVVFVNFEDFAEEINATLAAAKTESWFFSGYDADSLALEPVTGFVDYMLQSFPRATNANLELRTKSTQIRPLLAVEPRPNWVVAFTLSPPRVALALEHKAPSFARRLAAMRRLQLAGWQVGLRMDPVMVYDGYQRDYAEMLDNTFGQLDAGRLHSISVGGFRAPTVYFERMRKLYPFESSFAGPLQEQNDRTAYTADFQSEMIEFVTAKLANHVDSKKVYVCHDD